MNSNTEIPSEFNRIIHDFTSDISNTFPEYSALINKWWKPNMDIDNNHDIQMKQTSIVFRHCLKIYPERFFDILYKNTEIFNEDSEINTEFLPGISFKYLWQTDISEHTRETIWKYLQLILFTIINSVENQDSLGNAAKLFEAINEDELKQKIEETLENMQTLFNNTSSESLFNFNTDEDNNNDSKDDFNNESNTDNDTNDNTDANTNIPNLPDAQSIHDHLNSMMNGKLGKLAMELAEETAQELNMDMEDSGNVKDVFQKLFKNPGKMMDMLKTINSKIDSKIKSGEMKQSELMEEGMELFNKMKTMPGMDDMQKIFSQMGIPGLGKNTKLNTGAMEAQMKRNMKYAKHVERMKNKVEKNAQKQQQQNVSSSFQTQQPSTALSDEEIIKIFSKGDKPVKSARKKK